METYFKKNLKYLRTKKGISQLNLAEKIGKDQSSIAYWESGKAEPTLENVIKIADTLQVPIEDFVGKDLTTMDEFSFNKTQVLFDKYDRLSEDDKKFIETYIIEKDKQIDKQNNDF